MIHAWGRALRASEPWKRLFGQLVPEYQALYFSEGEVFCRWCERTIPAGQPFTEGTMGRYCATCLRAQRWYLQAGMEVPNGE